MTIRRRSLSWLFATILTATTAASVSAQSEEAIAEDWTYLTWTLSDEGASVDNDGGTWRANGLTLDATDPRASGLLDMAWNATGGGPDGRGMSLWEFRFELTNEGGSWSGAGSTVASVEGGEDGPETSIEPWRLQGAGAYEGLSLIMVTTNRDNDQERWGFIVPSADVPQAPEPLPQAATEASDATVISGEMTRDIHVWAPDGPGGSWPVVYAVPGTGGNPTELSYIAEQLADQGMLVFATAHTPEDFVVALEEAECGYRHVLDAAAEHGGDLEQPITVFGWSMGASIVLETGLNESVWGPGGSFEGCGDGASRPDVVIPLSGCWYQFEEQTFDLDVTGLANTEAPLTLIAGTDDDICHAWQSERATEALGGAGYDVELVEIEQGDHFSVLGEADGMEVVQAILAAIDAVRG